MAESGYRYLRIRKFKFIQKSERRTIMFERKSLLYLICAVVILIALGFAEPNEPNAPKIDPPTLKYPVASPRAALLTIPAPNINGQPLMVGAAENFARKNGEIMIPQNTRIVFNLSRELEGLWYKGSYGKLATAMILQVAVPVDPNADVSSEDTKIRWRTLGRKYRSDVRRGPSIGTANVKVPVIFTRPGKYRLRAIIKTCARPIKPKNENNNNGKQEQREHKPKAAEDLDIVHILVKVVDVPLEEIEPDEEMTLDPVQEYSIEMLGKEDEPEPDVVLPQE
jgi:hypothetical protein